MFFNSLFLLTLYICLYNISLVMGNRDDSDEVSDNPQINFDNL